MRARIQRCNINSRREQRLNGDRAPHRLSFIDPFVKCSAGWWAVTVAVLPPSWITATSCFHSNKSQVQETLGHPVHAQMCVNIWVKGCLCVVGYLTLTCL